MSDQDARTEAERRYPGDPLSAENGLIYPLGALIRASRDAFIAAAEWQRGVDQKATDDYMVKLAQRVMDVFDAADPEDTAEHLIPQVFAAIGIKEVDDDE
jgi:hypothetical protein